MSGDSPREVTEMSAELRPSAVRVAALFEARFVVGDPVWISINGVHLAGNVRVVLFTAGKVRFSVQVDGPDGPTTFHNIDSAFVEPRPEGVRLDYFHDNYS